MKTYKFTINGNDYDVEVKNIEDNIADVEINGTNYSVDIHQEVKKTKTPTLVRKPIARNKDIQKKDVVAGAQIKAPLPGTIFEILVKEGDTISKGQKVLIMEAMKMENDVLAEMDGTVTSLKVATGDSVLQGDVLMEIA